MSRFVDTLTSIQPAVTRQAMVKNRSSSGNETTYRDEWIIDIYNKSDYENDHEHD